MADVVQFAKRRKKPVEIDPALKGFIDRVIVPILVKEYLELAEADPDAANFVSSTAAPTLREGRP